MPKFCVDGSTTTVKQIYNGDARRQFDALWQYLQSIDERTADSAPTSQAKAGK